LGRRRGAAKTVQARDTQGNVVEGWRRGGKHNGWTGGEGKKKKRAFRAFQKGSPDGVGTHFEPGGRGVEDKANRRCWNVDETRIT